LKLQAKILLLLAPCVILPLVVLGWLAYGQLRDVSEHDMTREISHLLAEVVTRFNVEVQNANSSISLIAESERFQRYLESTRGGSPERRHRDNLLALLTGFHTAIPQYREIWLLFPDGRLDAKVPVDGRPDGLVASDDQFLSSVARKAPGIHVAFRENAADRTHSLYVIRKIAHANRNLNGVAGPDSRPSYLGITIDPLYLERRTLRRSFGTSTTLLVTDAKGTVVLAPEDSRIERKLPDDLFSALSKRASDGKFQEAEFNGTRWRFQGRRLPDNLYAFAGIPENELMEPLRMLQMLIALVTLCTVAITMALLSVVVNRSLVKPIHALGGAARALGSGDLELDLDVTRSDELGDLAVAFREIRDTLSRSSDEARRLAYHDSLTGLANRRKFNEHLTRALRFAERQAQYLALLYIDLDDFQRVNDTLGHVFGDHLLTELSDRLRECLRGYDHMSGADAQESKPIVARVGGDEFIVLIPNMTDPRQASVVAKRILRTLAQPYELKQQEHFVGASIGISVFPSDGKNANRLIKHADMAMHHAKQRGKNTYQYFQVSMNSVAKKRLNLETALRKAIEREEFVLHYQPLVDAANGRLIGVEALIRWMHPSLGLLPPARFIPLAEETRLIAPIGEWVIMEACRQNKAWQNIGCPKISVAVNVSNQQFSSHDLPRLVEKALLSTNLLPQYLDIEVTETTVMHAKRVVADTLAAIKSLGAKISMDDFGTGYSSLSALRSLPIDTLKIDRTFVMDIKADKREVPIISAIIAMAHSLGLKVTAEGVERIHQVEYLRAKGCHHFQGYLISRPVPAEEVPVLFQRGDLIDPGDLRSNAATA
jgi:diguanylate cyclase (GGDEF)-like protein